MATNRDVRRFIKSGPDLGRRVRALESKPQLASSSVEDGAVDSNDADGTLSAQFGKQHDGTQTSTSLAGPLPPVPTAPLLTPTVGGMSIRISGKFAAGAVSPMDFKQFEAHMSTNAGAVETDPHDSATMVAATSAESGASVVVHCGEIVEYTVWLVARTQSGKLSAPSAVATATPLPLVDGEAIQGEIDDANTRIDEAEQEIAQTGADLDGRLSDAKAAIDLAAARLAALGAAVDAGDVPESVAAAIGDFIQLNVSQLVATNASIDEAVVDKLFVDIFAAHKITAEQVLIGNMTNLFPDPKMTTGEPWDDSYWEATGGKTGGGSWYIPSSATGSGTVGGYYGSGTPGDRTTVVPGQYRVTVWVKPDENAVAGDLSIYMRLFDDDSDSFTWPTSGTRGDNKDTIPADTWGKFSAEFTVQEGFDKACIGFHARSSFDGAVRFSDPIWQQKVGAILLEDGSVTAPKITASEELTAKVANFLTVNADMIEANAIDGMTITGATLQTDAGVDTGVKLGPAGIQSWDSTGERTFYVDTAGNVTIAGVFETADYVEAESGVHFDSEQSQVQNLNVIESIGADDGSFGTLNIGGVDVDVETVSDTAPRGLIAGGSIDGSTKDSKAFPGSSSLDHPMLRFDIGDVERGRSYLISFHWAVAPAATGSYRTAMRYTTDGSGVTRDTPSFDGGLWRFSADAYEQSGYTETVYTPSSDGFLKVGLYAYVSSGTFQMKFTDNFYKPEAKCLDLGKTSGNSDQLRQASYASDQGDDGGGDSGGDQTPTKSRHPKTYRATWSASWDHGPSHKRSDGDRFARQGNLYVGHAGSCIGFDDAQIRSDLNGVPTSDIESITVRYRVAHTYASGGADLQMTWHNQHGEPSGYPSVTRMTKGDHDNAKGGNWYTEKLDTSFAAALRDGTAKGIGWDSNAGGSGYAYMQGYHNSKGQVNDGRPEITIVYKK